MAVKRTKAQWAEIMNKYEKSGQTMAAWCKENGVNAKTLGAHMNKGNRVRKIKLRTIDEWKELIRKQKSSGLSVGDWCKANGIKASTMWSAEARISKLQAAEEKNPKQKPPAAADWVEVKISGTAPAILPSTEQDVTTVKPLVEASPVSAQSSDGDNAACFTTSTKIPTGFEKDAVIRIRLKSLEIEVSSEYPIEKLMILMKGLADVC